MKTLIHFSDLKHTGQGCIAIPYGIACVAAYALKELNEKITVRLFKYPSCLSDAWEERQPQVACFSNYIWNKNLSYSFADRFKRKFPERIVIFGGPNYPLVPTEQKAFLHMHPAIDFYICREGEVGLSKLLQALQDYGWDAARLKSDRLRLPNCHYLAEGEFVHGDLLPPLANLDDLPSPYLVGLCDEFLADDNLVPIMQTARGCPFTCSYCEQGHSYFNYLALFSIERLKAELEYLAPRAQNSTLMLADSNFGMYPRDVEISQVIADIQRRYNAFVNIIGVIGKNCKERVLEVAALLNVSWLSAAVQSTDKKVMQNIRRQNVSLEQILQVARAGEDLGLTSFSEVILGLPGDTKAAHFKSMADLIDAGISVVRSHQFIMLSGSEAAMPPERHRFDLVSRFRIMPKTLSDYTLWNENFITPEVDEIVVASATLSFDDYLDCRLLDLAVEIFYNEGLFYELINFLLQKGISISAFIIAIYKQLRESDGPIAEIREGFWRENQEMWESLEEPLAFLHQPGVLDRYRNGELGNNEQWLYRVLAIFNHMVELHHLAFDTAYKMLKDAGKYNSTSEHYLSELAAFNLLFKGDLFATANDEQRTFHYDFAALSAIKFNSEPWQYACPTGIVFHFSHTAEHHKNVSAALKLSRTTREISMNLLNQTTSLSELFRQVTVIP